MTLCIASIALDMIDSDKGIFQQTIILCSDKKVEGWKGGGEIVQKQLWAGERWPALVAGDLGQALELLSIFREHMNAAGPQTNKSILETLRVPVREMRSRLIEARVHLNSGLAYQEFLALGAYNNPPEFFDRTSREIEDITLGCELLIVGYIEGCPGIFHVHQDGSVTEQQHFCAIGTGGDRAEPVFFWRKYDWNTPKNQAMYLAYEAKKLSEVMPGVGSETEMSIVRWWGEDKPLSVHSVDCEVEMQENFKKYGPQPLPSEDFPNLGAHCFTEW
jgi:hypothetical protein